MSFFINPLTTFFLARGRMPLESLAVLPVITGLGFVFRTAGIAMQEVVIALVGDGGANRRVLGRFTLRLGTLSTLGLGLVVFTPLAGVWYGLVSGLSPDLVAFSILPGAWLVLLPFIEAVLSFERGVFVRAHRTAPLSIAVAVQLAVTTSAFVIMVLLLRTVGAMAIGPALTAGYLAGLAVLLSVGRRAFGKTAILE
jgi:progressive ankylosis protein